MLLNVVEGVLSHIGHSQVGVLPHCALWGLQLSSEQLDHGGLAGSICANDSHARVQGDSNADALKYLAGCVGVSADRWGNSQQRITIQHSMCSCEPQMQVLGTQAEQATKTSSRRNR